MTAAAGLISQTPPNALRRVFTFMQFGWSYDATAKPRTNGGPYLPAGDSVSKFFAR